MSRERYATARHDYLYGVLEIESWRVPNCSGDLFSVSRDVFKPILEKEGTINVLSACGLRNHYKKDHAVNPDLKLNQLLANKLLQWIYNGLDWPSWLSD